MDSKKDEQQNRRGAIDFNVKGPNKLVAVVLGEATGPERSVRAANLLEHGFRTYGWKTILGSQTLDTLPVDENAKMAVTKPGRVISAVCGTGGRAVAKVKKGGTVAAAAPGRGDESK